MLFQLTYISTAIPTLLLSDVESILLGSRRNNRRDEISGLLVFDGKRFLQGLEGPRALVQAAFDRISADRRHRAIVRLSEREIAAREFGDWSMASHIVGPVVGGGNLVGQVEAMTANMPDANIRETFRGFAKLRAAA